MEIIVREDHARAGIAQVFTIYPLKQCRSRPDCDIWTALIEIRTFTPCFV